jgi:hypothetical protein
LLRFHLPYVDNYQLEAITYQVEGVSCQSQLSTPWKMYCVPARPKLYMNLKTTSFACFPNELLWILITLRNDGNQPLRDIIFSSDTNLSSPLMIPGGSCKPTDIQSDYLLSSVLNPGQTLDQDIMCHIPINTAVGWLETIFTLRAVGDVQELPVDQAFPKASPLLSKPLMYGFIDIIRWGYHHFEQSFDLLDLPPISSQKSYH